MTVCWSLALVRHWIGAAAVVAVAGTVLAAAGDLPAYVPMSTGGRTVAHCVLAFTPVLTALALVDPHPEISHHLRREPAVRLVGLLGYTAAQALMVLLTWRQFDTPTWTFELTGTLLLASISVVAVSLAGTVGLLPAGLAAMTWLVAGDALLGPWGFPEPGASVPFWAPRSAVVIITAALVYVASAVLGVRTGARDRP